MFTGKRKLFYILNIPMGSKRAYHINLQLKSVFDMPSEFRRRRAHLGTNLPLGNEKHKMPRC